MTVQYIPHYSATTERVSMSATDLLNYAASNSTLYSYPVYSWCHVTVP